MIEQLIHTIDDDDPRNPLAAVVEETCKRALADRVTGIRVTLFVHVPGYPDGVVIFGFINGEPRTGPLFVPIAGVPAFQAQLADMMTGYAVVMAEASDTKH